MKLNRIFHLSLLILTTICISLAPAQMVLIPGGEYLMGDHHPEDHHMPGSQWAVVHAVHIDSFWIDIYEVTNEDYCEYLNSAYEQGLIEVTDGVVYKADDTAAYFCTSDAPPREIGQYQRIHWDGETFTITEDKENHPVARVSWFGAAAFANWKSAMNDLPECYNMETWVCDFDAGGFRLPTEAEWEKASRGGHHDPYYMYPWGSNHTNNNEGNFLGSGDPYERETIPTTPVGYYEAQNDYGLYDIVGNVWEWCYDYWDLDYPSESPYDNPTGPDKGTIHVNKGGGFHSRPTVNSRNASRCNGCHFPNDPGSGNTAGYNIGFRLASSTDPEAQGVDEGRSDVLPGEFRIDSVYPNPFNSTTVISVSLPVSSELKLSVYNITGQEIAIIGNGRFYAGSNQFTFDASGLANGVYFVKASVDGKMNAVRKIVLMK